MLFLRGLLFVPRWLRGAFRMPFGVKKGTINEPKSGPRSKFEKVRFCLYLLCFMVIGLSRIGPKSDQQIDKMLIGSRSSLFEVKVGHLVPNWLPNGPQMGT